jgi:hypothetical protein
MSEAQVAANEAEDQDLQIEVEDDTPAEDRGRTPLPQNLVEELEKDDLEEYSDKVKKRLSQMKKVWHDERRQKEMFLREKEEALRFAQAQAEEVKRLRSRVGTGERAYIDEVTRSTKNDLDNAKNKLKAAYESGDSDAIANAQEALTDVKLRLREVERYKPSLQDDENDVESTQQTREPPRQAQPVDQKAVDWAKKNTWFGSDEEMTALALGLHEKLVRSGVDPTSDEYYRQVDTTMRKRFPESFEDDDTQPVEQEREKPAPRAKPANVVAPATRSTAPKQVRLTQTQVALAKRLGLSNEAYARELMKLENN